MIYFERLTWKNLLSTGEQEASLEINEDISTLIVGTNGSGKSTILDALCFNLYGKAFRKINKDQLINNINKKKLLTVSEFRIGQTKYKVVRGIKPNIFEIWENGEKKNEESDVRTQQTFLENQILKTNYKSFTQIAVLGSAHYKPFMQLDLADRRQIIEDLLDITVFSEMNSILKAKIKATQSDKQTLLHDFAGIKQNHDLNEGFLKEKTEQQTQRMAELETDKERLENELAELSKKLITKKSEIYVLDFDNKEKIYSDKSKALNNKKVLLPVKKQSVESIKKSLVNINENITNKEKVIITTKEKIKTLQKKVSEAGDKSVLEKERDALAKDNEEYGKTVYGLSNDNNRYDHDIEFLNDHDTCDRCNQSIDLNFKKTKLKEATELKTKNEAEILRLYDVIADNKTKIKLINDKIKTIDDLSEVLKDTEKSLVDLEKSIVDNKSAIKEREEEIVDLEAEIDLAEKSIITMEKDVADLNFPDLKIKYNALIDQRNELNASCASTKTVLDRVENDIDKIKSSGTDIEEKKKQLEELKELMKVSAKKILDINTLIENYGIISGMLKDDGIKTRIIRYYLPFINKTLNEVLEMFSFPVSFIFDENFQETIKSRYRDNFSYMSFSEGEKARINLSLMLTWRKISMMKNRSAMNLVIFDEVFDGSMDGNGADDFIVVMETIKKGSSIFVISHKENLISSVGFDNVLKADKRSNFSSLSEIGMSN